MSLKVSYDKVSNANEAFGAVKKQITPELIAKFNVSAELSYVENKSVSAKGKGFELTISFTDKEAQVSLELGLLLKPFKSMVLDAVEKQLKRVV